MVSLTIRRPRQIALFLLGLLVVILVASLPQYLQAGKSLQWPTANGVVTVSRLQIGYLKQMKGYYGDVQYQYWVGNTEYRGNRLSFNRVHLATEDASQQAIADYPVGKTVKVHYDPEHPDFAVLKPGLRGEMKFLFYLDIAFIASFSAAFLVVFFVYRRGV
jgi:hypothetical protein